MPIVAKDSLGLVPREPAPVNLIEDANEQTHFTD